MRPSRCLFAALIATLPAVIHGRPVAFSETLFLTPSAAREIYREGWIDLNKNGRCDPYEDPMVPEATRIEDLLTRMTLEEMTCQMATLYGYPRVSQDELPDDSWKSAVWKDGIGNIDEHMNGNTGWSNNLSNPEHDFPWSLHARALNEVQRWFLEETRLGIPVDFTNEGIRGLHHTKATSFPAEVGVASTWNAPLAREIGGVTGREARALGYTHVYSPVLDLSRDPRWGRVVECYSEDPFLTGALGLQQVLGLQEHGVASTLKHFAVYSIPNGGRDGHARTDPHASWLDVRTLFLEPFRRAIMEGGALGVMSSYNDYNGVPVQSSHRFLTEILRGEYGFEGYVVSDSAAVEFIHEKHRTAATPREAIRQSVEAGLNIRTHFTPPADYILPLRELVREGALDEAVIEDRVRDILRVKFRLGLFDRPFVEPDEAERTVRAPAHLAVAERAARESIVLLKNDNERLPLARTDLQRILVTGPLADDGHAWWSRYGAQRLDFITPLEGLRAKLGDEVEVRYVKGVEAKDANWPESDILKPPAPAEVRAGIAEAVEAARSVDVIIAVLGETDELCRESSSRISLQLPGYQQELLEALHATGTPVVLVLSSGRALSLNWADRHLEAILEMWFPGEEGGAAVADVLFGDYNPAGRLPVTFPKSVGQIPYNFPARPGSLGRDYGQVEGPLYPFGHGLSYTTFAYSELELSSTAILPDESIEVRVRISNTGLRAGDEVVQLYLRDDYSSVLTFDQQLRGFSRLHLEPGESQVVTFTLGPDALQLFNAAEAWVVEPGRFTVMLGASSADLRLTDSFVVTAPDGSVPVEDPIKGDWIDGR